MKERALLRERLSKVEALLARPGHEGERIAAQAAVERIGERLAQLAREDRVSDVLLSMSDLWAPDMLAAFETQRAAAGSLFRSNLAWVRGATSFLRAAWWPHTQALTRFWCGGEPEM